MKRYVPNVVGSGSQFARNLQRIHVLQDRLTRRSTSVEGVCANGRSGQGFPLQQVFQNQGV